jgi:endonuclease/exonuclease/phosphatase family metal-dependent hydrolase
VKVGRHGIAAALIGCVLSLGVHSIPPERDCPQGTCAFAAPTAVRGVASASNWLQLTWDRVPKAFAYRVQVAPENNFLGDEVITVVQQDPDRPELLAIPRLNPGRTYHIRVSVIDRASNQQSEWSAPTTYATKGPMRLSVGTYNVHNPRDNDWDERVPLVADGIVSEKLQLLGVQEVYRENQRRNLLQYVNARSTQLNGRPIYAMAPAANSDDGYDNRILYDTRLFSLEQSGGRPYEYQVGGDEVDRWFAWAMFTHRASGWKVLFVTTHLAPHNVRAVRKQWHELIDRVNSLRSWFKVPWVVVAGDFNTTKYRKPANTMLEKMRDNGYGDILGQQYRTFDTEGARAQVRSDAWLDSYNGFERDIDRYDHDKDHNGNSFDWIFASNELAVPDYRVYARYDDDGKLHEPIPSDHFLVRATLSYDPPQIDRPTVNVAATVKSNSVN